MTDYEKLTKEGSSELPELIDLIVDRCRKDGQLVTIHQHYPIGSAAFRLGWNLAMGAIAAGMTVAILVHFMGVALHWVGSLFA